MNKPDILITITKDQALKEYCNGKQIYITTNCRYLWSVPPSYFYGSHDSIEALFYRSIPKYEGTVYFYKEI